MLSSSQVVKVFPYQLQLHTSGGLDKFHKMFQTQREQLLLLIKDNNILECKTQLEQFSAYQNNIIQMYKVDNQLQHVSLQLHHNSLQDMDIKRSLQLMLDNNILMGNLQEQSQQLYHSNNQLDKLNNLIKHKMDYKFQQHNPLPTKHLLLTNGQVLQYVIQVSMHLHHNNIQRSNFQQDLLRGHTLSWQLEYQFQLKQVLLNNKL